MVRIPGGTFRMGSNDHYPEEAPVHRLSLDGFCINRTPVGQFLSSFKDYPPSQRAQSFSIDQIVEKMQRSLEATQSR
jgi:formylglycine-generating enzyme required for sulfatase activity